MKSNRILLLYKRSSLSISGKLSPQLRSTPRFAANHAVHYQSLAAVEQVLKDSGVAYDKKNRAQTIEHGRYTIIITVGGDGTVLQAARQAARHQLLLGVNSDPSWSVGQFCYANAGNFDRILRGILDGRAKVKNLYKLALGLNDGKRLNRTECLNDILICHANPAGMSRYCLQIGSRKEEQRSSGIWFASAAGSTGAIMSAGGKKLPLESRNIQYRPRELYHARDVAYQFTGGVLPAGKSAVITSHMAHGRIFVDGSHVKFPFVYGNTVTVENSGNYVRLVYA